MRDVAPTSPTFRHAHRQVGRSEVRPDPQPSLVAVRGLASNLHALVVVSPKSASRVVRHRGAEQRIPGARDGTRAARLRAEIAAAEAAISGMMHESGDGAGDDQADAGSKNISREHEMALANNARAMLAQTEHALGRLERGDFGLCESCASPIGKARLQAFPRATLCVACKQRQERR